MDVIARALHVVARWPPRLPPLRVLKVLLVHRTVRPICSDYRSMRERVKLVNGLDAGMQRGVDLSGHFPYRPSLNPVVIPIDQNLANAISIDPSGKNSFQCFGYAINIAHFTTTVVGQSDPSHIGWVAYGHVT